MSLFFRRALCVSKFESHALGHLVAGFLALSRLSSMSAEEVQKSATEWLCSRGT